MQFPGRWCSETPSAMPNWLSLFEFNLRAYKRENKSDQCKGRYLKIACCIYDQQKMRRAIVCPEGFTFAKVPFLELRRERPYYRESGAISICIQRWETSLGSIRACKISMRTENLSALPPQVHFCPTLRAEVCIEEPCLD